jgi:hypothetical protein
MQRVKLNNLKQEPRQLASLFGPLTKGKEKRSRNNWQASSKRNQIHHRTPSVLCFMPHIDMCAAEDREAGLTVDMFFPHAFPRAFRHGGLCFLLDCDPSSRVSSLSFLSV